MLRHLYKYTGKISHIFAYIQQNWLMNLHMRKNGVKGKSMNEKCYLNEKMFIWYKKQET